VHLGYNGAGELEWRRKQDGTLITLERDERHRVKQINYPASGGNAAFSVTYAFDEFGRLKSTTDQTGTTNLAYDSLNRLTGRTPPSPQRALTYGYTKDATLKRWITTVTMSGIGSYTYREDTKGRLAEVLNPYSQLFRMEYDKDGKNTLTEFPAGQKELRTYTPRDWLASIQVQRANGQVVDTLQYFYTDANGVYDPLGRIRREVDGAGQTHAFAYDQLSQLVAESHPDFGTIVYEYDKAGNRTKKSTSAGIDYYGVNAATNRLEWVNRGTNAAPTSGQANAYTRLVYDGNGRVIQRDRRTDGGVLQIHDLYWDGDDRLRTIKQGGVNKLTAAYSGDGIRVNKWDAWTGTHDYSWGPGGVVHDSNTNTTYTPGLSHRTGSADRFYHSDWLGSTRFLSDQTGIDFPSALRYDGYGRRSATGGVDPYHPTDFQFAGKWGYQVEHSTLTDPGIGLHYLQQRYYDSAIGRFVSEDPIGHTGGLNLYRYVENDPINGVDPFGLQTSRTEVNHLLQAIGRGNVEEAIWTLESGLLSPASFSAYSATLLISPAVQQRLGQAFQYLPRLGTVNLPPCQIVAQRAFNVLQQLGASRVQVYLVQRFGGGPFYTNAPAAKFQFHYAVRYGDTIIDSMTGPMGQNITAWMQRFNVGGQLPQRVISMRDVTSYFASGRITHLSGLGSK